MTPSQVAKLIGCHPGTIRQRIREGVLDASPNPVRKHEYIVHRPSLVRWLSASGWPPDEIRRAIPQEGPLLSVGLRQSLVGSLARISSRSVRGFFEAAMAVSDYHPWGVLVDVANLGSARSLDEIRDYAKYEVDRPLLIGIVGDDFHASAAFDLEIPDTLPVGNIAQRIRAVRPWGR